MQGLDDAAKGSDNASALQVQHLAAQIGAGGLQPGAGPGNSRFGLQSLLLQLQGAVVLYPGLLQGRLRLGDRYLAVIHRQFAQQLARLHALAALHRSGQDFTGDFRFHVHRALAFGPAAQHQVAGARPRLDYRGANPRDVRVNCAAGCRLLLASQRRMLGGGGIP